MGPASRLVMDAMALLDPEGRGITALAFLDLLFSEGPPSSASLDEMRTAVRAVTCCPQNKRPGVIHFGKFLVKHRGRRIDNRSFERTASSMAPALSMSTNGSPCESIARTRLRMSSSSRAASIVGSGRMSSQFTSVIRGTPFSQGVVREWLYAGIGATGTVVISGVRVSAGTTVHRTLFESLSVVTRSMRRPMMTRPRFFARYLPKRMESGV